MTVLLALGAWLLLAIVIGLIVGPILRHRRRVLSARVDYMGWNS
jgi:type II secretory pathway component PulM